MNLRFFLAFATLGLALATPLRAQRPAAWDAARQATGWAYQEVDGSLVFFDPSARALRTWMKGSGLLSTLPLAMPEARKVAPLAPKVEEPQAPRASDYDAAGALLYGIPRHQRPQAVPAKPARPAVAPAEACEARPERWVIDSYARTWMVCDGRLVIFNKDGQLEQALALPAPVEDLAVGREGILVLYRTPRPCLEKRDLRSGAVLWTYGDRAQLKEAADQPLLVPLNRMAVGSDGAVYLAEGPSLALTVLDPSKGPKDAGQTFFTCREALPGRAQLGRAGRGPLVAWPGREVLFGAFAPTQVKGCGAPEGRGLVLARFDLAAGSLEWLPTTLGEGHQLLGLLDHEAVFLAPGGGLAYAPIH